MISCGRGESVLNSQILPGPAPLLLIPFQTDYQREQYAVFVSENAKKVPDSSSTPEPEHISRDLSLICLCVILHSKSVNNQPVPP